MTREYLKMESEGRPFEELEQMTLGSLRRAVQEGDVVHGLSLIHICIAYAGILYKSFLKDFFDFYSD